MRKVEQFKKENEGRYIYYNGAVGLDGAILNDWIVDTYEEAVRELAARECVSEEDIENNSDDWYYIFPVEEVEEDSLEDALS